MLTAIAVWWLLVLHPYDEAGRQIGPFANAQQCELAREKYDGRGGPKLTRTACVPGLAVVPAPRQ